MTDTQTNKGTHGRVNYLGVALLENESLEAAIHKVLDLRNECHLSIA